MTSRRSNRDVTLLDFGIELVVAGLETELDVLAFGTVFEVVDFGTEFRPRTGATRSGCARAVGFGDGVEPVGPDGNALTTAGLLPVSGKASTSSVGVALATTVGSDFPKDSTI